jgi:large subunit ribosomal protein L21
LRSCPNQIIIYLNYQQSAEKGGVIQTVDLFGKIGYYISTMKFAVITTGGKQYKVSEGESLKIERLAGEHNVGDKITFDKVLLKADGDKTEIGLPTIAGAAVTGEIEAIARAPKVTVIKFKQKSRYFKKNGHRQHYFKIKINAI